MANVSSIVDTETNGQHDGNAGHNVDANPPEVKEAHNIDQGHGHGAQHEHAQGEVAKQQPGDEEHTGHGQSYIP